ncbi:MAG: hypothetical protein WCO51_11230 [bacterium]|jgi:hypothetical protein
MLELILSIIGTLIGAMVWIGFRKERVEKLERTRLWLDEFIEQFVFAPTADVPDFGTQSMPKLESLAMLYEKGLVDCRSIDERLKGDLSNYFLELKLFLIEHIKTERAIKLGSTHDYPLLWKMADMSRLEKDERFIHEVELLQQERHRFEISSSAIIFEPNSEDDEPVFFEPNEMLYQELQNVLESEKDRSEQ